MRDQRDHFPPERPESRRLLRQSSSLNAHQDQPLANSTETIFSTLQPCKHHSIASIKREQRLERYHADNVKHADLITVVVAMSGGVDSSVVAGLLVNQVCEPIFALKIRIKF